MANNKNNKPKKKSKKGPESKKSCSSRASSGQKENRPKKTKIQPDPADRIAMSQELIKHTKRKATATRTRTKQDSKRVLPNGKIMPSLADLEKIFENSDDDTDSKDLPKTDTTSSPVDNIVIDSVFPPNTCAKVMQQCKEILNNRSITPENDENDDTDSKDLPKTDTTSSPVDNIVIDSVYSLNTCAKVTQQCKEILNNRSITPENDATSKIKSPPRKRLKFETPDNIEECEDLPVVITTEIQNRYRYNILDTQVIKSYGDDLRISSIPEFNKNDQKETYQSKIDKKEADDGNLSETSVDSNKTIEYKITPSTLQSNITSKIFSPLPSTSKDDKTFNKNDELFLECTKEINNNKIKEESSPMTDIPLETRELVGEVNNNNKTKEESLPITDIQMETSELVSEVNNNNTKEKSLLITDIPVETRKLVDAVIVEECQKEVKEEVVNDVEIVEDDDCVFVDCYTDTTKQVSKEPEIIDLEYDFIDTDTYNFHTSTYDDVDDEVIDVDALIAKNQSILNKYKTTNTNKLDSTNLVVDVDVSKIVGNSTETNNIHKQDNKQIVQSTAPKTSNNTFNLQEHPNPEDEVINITDLDAENRRQNQVRRNLSNNQPVSYSDIIDVESTTNETRNQHTFTEQDVSEFFNRDSNAGHIYPPCLSLYLFDLVRQLEFAEDQFSETSQRTYDTPEMFQNNPLVAGTSQGTPSDFPIYQQTQPSCSHSTTQKKQRTKKTKKNNKSKSPARPSPPRSPDKPSRKLGECPICMEKLSEKAIASTICGHVFCMICLEQAIRTNKRCPTCRKMIKKNGYHQIFL